jgi:hypothetical protein
LKAGVSVRHDGAIQRLIIFEEIGPYHNSASYFGTFLTVPKARREYRSSIEFMMLGIRQEAVYPVAATDTASIF